MKISDKKLKILCTEFREGMLKGRSSKGKCAILSWALQGYLSFLHLETEVHEGSVGTWNHLWIVLPDGRVIDCTADQFNKKKKKYPEVHIGEPLDIHRGGKPYKVII